MHASHRDDATLNQREFFLLFTPMIDTWTLETTAKISMSIPVELELTFLNVQFEVSPEQSLFAPIS